MKCPNCRDQGDGGHRDDCGRASRSLCTAVRRATCAGGRHGTGLCRWLGCSTWRPSRAEVGGGAGRAHEMARQGAFLRVPMPRSGLAPAWQAPAASRLPERLRDVTMATMAYTDEEAGARQLQAAVAGPRCGPRRRRGARRHRLPEAKAPRSAVESDGAWLGDRPERWPRPSQLVTLVVVAAAVVFTFVQFQPSNLFRNTTISGGDTGATCSCRGWPSTSCSRTSA